MAKNKIKYGLKNAYVAPITRAEDGTATYETPHQIPGATELTLTASVDTANISADDDPMYAQAVDDKGYEGEFIVQVLGDEDKVDLLGWKKDQNDVLYEPENPVKKEFAFLCEFSGDAHAIRHVFYRCLAGKPDINSATKGGGLESKPDTVPMTMSRDPHTGISHAVCTPAQKEQYDNWYSKVYEIQEVEE